MPSEIYDIAVSKLPSEDIDHHNSDLYIKMTPESKKLIETLEYKDSGMLTTFKDDEGITWYELPFCYPMGKQSSKNVKAEENTPFPTTEEEMHELYRRVLNDETLTFNNMEQVFLGESGQSIDEGVLYIYYRGYGQYAVPPTYNEFKKLIKRIEGRDEKRASKLAKGGYSNNPNYFGDWFGKGQIDYSKIINPEDSGKVFMLKIWGGRGYILDVYLVKANDYEDAIDKVFEWSYENEGANKIIFDYGYLSERCHEDYESEYFYGREEGKPSDKMSYEDFETEWMSDWVNNSDYNLFARAENFFIDELPEEYVNKKQSSKKKAYKNVPPYSEKERDRILNKFQQEYDFLYEHDDNVAGYDEAVDAYEQYRHNTHFMGLVVDLVRKRGDAFSSDREVGALMFALDSLGYLNEIDAMTNFNEPETKSASKNKSSRYDGFTYDVDENGVMKIFTPDNRLVSEISDCKNCDKSTLENIFHETLDNSSFGKKRSSKISDKMKERLNFGYLSPEHEKSLPKFNSLDELENYIKQTNSFPDNFFYKGGLFTMDEYDMSGSTITYSSPEIDMGLWVDTPDNRYDHEGDYKNMEISIEEENGPLYRTDITYYLPKSVYESIYGNKTASKKKASKKVTAENMTLDDIEAEDNKDQVQEEIEKIEEKPAEEIFSETTPEQYLDEALAEDKVDTINEVVSKCIDKFSEKFKDFDKYTVEILSYNTKVLGDYKPNTEEMVEDKELNANAILQVILSITNNADETNVKKALAVFSITNGELHWTGTVRGENDQVVAFTEEGLDSFFEVEDIKEDEIEDII